MVCCEMALLLCDGDRDCASYIEFAGADGRERTNSGLQMLWVWSCFFQSGNSMVFQRIRCMMEAGPWARSLDTVEVRFGDSVRRLCPRNSDLLGLLSKTLFFGEH